jgi:hypothetical protein
MFRIPIKIFLFVFLCSDAFGVSSQVMDNYYNILKLLNGSPILVGATPQYCGVAPPSGDNISQEIEWRLGVGSCSEKYIPDYQGFFTPLSQAGELSHFFFDSQKYTSLCDSIDFISSHLNGVDIATRIDIQMTIWELVSTLQWRRDLKVSWDPALDQSKVDLLLTKAMGLLGKTLFSKIELKAIDAFKQEASVNGLLENGLKNGCYKEIGLVGGMHESMSQGRLRGRAFLGVANDGCQEFEKLTSSKNWNAIREMPERISGVKSVLILYLNVLMDDFSVYPTDVVQSWREINYSSVFSRNNSLASRIKTFDARVLNRLKASHKDESIRYEWEDGNKLVGVGHLIDVNPVRKIEGVSQVTNLKFNCYSCHQGIIKSLDVRTVGVRKDILMTNPFSQDKSLLINEVFYKHVKNKFQEWNGLYAVHLGKDGSH